MLTRHRFVIIGMQGLLNKRFPQLFGCAGGRRRRGAFNSTVIPAPESRSFPRRKARSAPAGSQIIQDDDGLVDIVLSPLPRATCGIKTKLNETAFLPVLREAAVDERIDGPPRLAVTASSSKDVDLFWLRGDARCTNVSSVAHARYIQAGRVWQAANILPATSGILFGLQAAGMQGGVLLVWTKMGSDNSNMVLMYTVHSSKGSSTVAVVPKRNIVGDVLLASMVPTADDSPFLVLTTLVKGQTLRQVFTLDFNGGTQSWGEAVGVPLAPQDRVTGIPAASTQGGARVLVVPVEAAPTSAGLQTQLRSFSRVGTPRFDLVRSGFGQAASLETCRQIATRDSMVFAGITSCAVATCAPLGCYVFGRDGRVYYNAQKRGACSAARQCYVMATPPWVAAKDNGLLGPRRARRNGDASDATAGDATTSRPGSQARGRRAYLSGATLIFDGSLSDISDYKCDDCEKDNEKCEEGKCGCGKVETDLDEDGVLDCLDGCPLDKQKIEPGTCGCNQEEQSPCIRDKEEDAAAPPLPDDTKAFEGCDTSKYPIRERTAKYNTCGYTDETTRNLRIRREDRNGQSCELCEESIDQCTCTTCAADRPCSFVSLCVCVVAVMVVCARMRVRGSGGGGVWCSSSSAPCNAHTPCTCTWVGVQVRRSLASFPTKSLASQSPSRREGRSRSGATCTTCSCQCVPIFATKGSASSCDARRGRLRNLA